MLTTFNDCDVIKRLCLVNRKTLQLCSSPKFWEGKCGEHSKDLSKIFIDLKSGWRTYNSLIQTKKIMNARFRLKLRVKDKWAINLLTKCYERMVSDLTGPRFKRCTVRFRTTRKNKYKINVHVHLTTYNCNMTLPDLTREQFLIHLTRTLSLCNVTEISDKLY